MHKLCMICILYGNSSKSFLIILPQGALAGQPCTDALTKGRKTYLKPCVRHFEIGTPFHFVQSKTNPFQSSKLKRILSYSATFCKICKTHTLFLQNSIFPTLNDDSAAHFPARKKYPFSSFFFWFTHRYTTD